MVGWPWILAEMALKQWPWILSGEMALVAAVAKLALFTVVAEMPLVAAAHDVDLVAAVAELTLVDAVDEMAHCGAWLRWPWLLVTDLAEMALITAVFLVAKLTLVCRG